MNVMATAKKSNHKHTYKDCLVINKDNTVCSAQYCSKCGKINSVHLYELSENNTCLSSREILQKHVGWPVFPVDSFYDRNVTLPEKKGVKSGD